MTDFDLATFDENFDDFDLTFDFDLDFDLESSDESLNSDELLALEFSELMNSDDDS
jgi:hypothetical protein